MEKVETKLINYRTYNLDRSKITPIDRWTSLGNFFIIGKDGNREEVIAKYKIYFYERLKNDPSFKKLVRKLAGKTLGCWCTPLPCHGDVIIEYLEGLE